MKTLIAASAGGANMGKNEVEAYQILDNIALKNWQWPVERVVSKKQAGAYDLDVFTNLATQVSTLSKNCNLHNKKVLKYLHLLLKKVHKLIPLLNVL